MVRCKIFLHLKTRIGRPVPTHINVSAYRSSATREVLRYKQACYKQACYG